MTVRSDTWMPLYVGDYLRDTGDLTTVEHGAYLLLIMQAWTRGGALPADMERLRNMTRMTVTEWKKSANTILSFFTLDGDAYRHKRIEREIKRAEQNSEKRSAAAKARWDKHLGRVNADAETDCSERESTTDEPRAPEPSPSPERKKEGELRSPRKRKSKTLESDPELARFWAPYPRKTEGPAACHEEFLAARKRASLEQILAGLDRYPFSPDPQYQPTARTWLKGSRWLGETNTPPATTVVSQKSDTAASQWAMREFDLPDRQPEFDIEGKAE